MSVIKFYNILQGQNKRVTSPVDHSDLNNILKPIFNYGITPKRINFVFQNF
jgi:hypothetical protein